MMQAQQTMACDLDVRTFPLYPAIRGTAEKFNGLQLIGVAKKCMENFIDTHATCKLEGGATLTDQEREEALCQFLASTIGQVISRRGLQRVGLSAILIHKHYDVQKNWLQVTRKEHDDDGREVYVATPMNVSHMNQHGNLVLVPFKWRLVVCEETKRLYFEAWEFIDVTSLDSLSAEAYRRAAQVFETDLVGQRELAEVMLRHEMHKLFGVGTGMFPVLRPGQDIAMELNDKVGAQSRLTVIRANESGLTGYWEHPQYLETTANFAGQTVNTVWTFTCVETRVNGIVTFKCDGCTHICVCISCS